MYNFLLLVFSDLASLDLILKLRHLLIKNFKLIILFNSEHDLKQSIIIHLLYRKRKFPKKVTSTEFDF